ncbi:molybdopterin converting factor subunit 1 [Silvimonas iriomotensis]|uniref:Molybdopterin synthase sulfur carrier subunit n=1 Tax=Silvimonas iriomotensis TaxID=449662 RepID=A0ABQ2PCP7_9NEIS|nr:molybdopterin converting factor subunit 1 [Silvimonas iriomotensis]GGP23034.1 molybdopterin synthase sulfur carrier subunit [Silvimonas iriomotensis]
MKQLELRYFARLRDTLGLDAESVSVPTQVHTVRDLVAWLRQRGGEWEAQLNGARPFRAAINQDLVALDEPIPDGAEVALFPPVTGG